MNKLCCLILVFFTGSLLYINAQTLVEGLDACVFDLVQKGDTIQFVKVDADLETVKPVIIFCQGSLPVPLIIKFDDGEESITALNNFDYKKISKDYHIIVLSMPFIPVEVGESSLNSQFAYVTHKNDEHSYPRKYLDANYSDKYVERGNAVIKFLLKQKWVDKKHIAIVGHSQGAKVAVEIASTNKNISALGFLSGNPLGRVDQFIRQNRLSVQKGLISQTEAQKEINGIYDWWYQMNCNPNGLSQRGEDGPKTVISFSKPLVDDLLKIKIPIYIAYGTEDIVAFYCDLLPIDFIRAGKTNYKSVPYLGLEHNFFEVDSTGKPDYDKCHWNDVMTDFIDWLQKNDK